MVIQYRIIVKAHELPKRKLLFLKKKKEKRERESHSSQVEESTGVDEGATLGEVTGNRGKSRGSESLAGDGCK